MTIIAYKDGVVAWDSRLTQGSGVLTNNWQKSKTIGAVTVWVAGDASALSEMAAWIQDRSYVFPLSANFGAILWDGKSLVLAGKDSNEVVDFLDVPMDDVYAMGSGASYAIGAMDAGSSALEATKIACKRDVFCGGRIRTKKLW